MNFLFAVAPSFAFRRASAPKRRESLLEMIHTAGGGQGTTILRVDRMTDRLRAPLWSFSLAASLAVVMLLGGFHLRHPKWNLRLLVWPTRDRFRRLQFFLLKSVLLLLLTLLMGLEFTHATAVTMLGGCALTAEPLTAWLWLAMSFGVLLWAIADQQARCRTCLCRLGLAAKVGCPGCVLLDWAGTELVCAAGHGMLHVPDMIASWQEPHSWTALDESWSPLFPSDSIQVKR